MRLIDLTGQKFGRWTVISRAENSNKGQARWNCKCECGNTSTLTGQALRTNHSKSCGCFKSEVTIMRNGTHGQASDRTSEYNIWSSMIQRCTNVNNPAYSNYGGRGITVSVRWLQFENFYEDMGNRPDKNHSIDRINNNLGYEPSNCRWANKETQARNKRVYKRNASGVSGVKWNEKLAKWEVTIHFDSKDIYLGVFKNKEDAIEARKDAEKKYWKKPS